MCRKYLFWCLREWQFRIASWWKEMPADYQSVVEIACLNRKQAVRHKNLIINHLYTNIYCLNMEFHRQDGSMETVGAWPRLSCIVSLGR